MIPGDQYLLQDGTYAEPAQCSVDGDGVLRHANGMAVVLRADGYPQTLLTGAVLNGNALAASGGDE